MLYRSAKGGSCLFAEPRIGSIWTHQNSPFYQRLRQRKNKQGAETHVFVLAEAANSALQLIKTIPRRSADGRVFIV